MTSASVARRALPLPAFAPRDESDNKYDKHDFIDDHHEGDPQMAVLGSCSVDLDLAGKEDVSASHMLTPTRTSTPRSLTPVVT